MEIRLPNESDEIVTGLSSYKDDASTEIWIQISHHLGDEETDTYTQVRLSDLKKAIDFFEKNAE